MVKTLSPKTKKIIGLVLLVVIFVTALAVGLYFGLRKSRSKSTTTNQSSLPNIPTLPNVTFPTLPNVTFPTSPNVTFPTSPNVRFPTLPNGTFPTSPNCTFPTSPNCTFTSLAF